MFDETAKEYRTLPGIKRQLVAQPPPQVNCNTLGIHSDRARSLRPSKRATLQMKRRIASVAVVR
jgi:hypothetical protein